METLQHFLLFLIQFTIVSGISLVTIAFVDYVIPTPQIVDIADDRTVQRNSESETTIDVNRVPAKPETLLELLAMSDEAIEQTVRKYQNIQPVNLSQIESNDPLCVDTSQITIRQARKIAKILGIKQKVNGKDAPKSWLIAQIEQKIKEQPDITKVVAEILAA